MLQRYVLPDQAAAEREFLPGEAWWRFEVRFNVSQAEYVPVVRMHEGRSEGVMMRWGLIPAWAEGTPPSESTLCVGFDDVETSDIYRPAWAGGRRCILPVAGFFAWQLTPDRYRQPYFIRVGSRAAFGFAAVWDRSVSEEDDVIESCSVIEVTSNELVAGIANTESAMPAILRRRDYDKWLNGTPAQAKSVLKPYRPQWMEAHAVSPRINSSRHDDAGLIQPVA